MEITLETRSPVHVGTGEQRRFDNYVTSDRRAHLVDVDKYFREHEDEIDSFVSAIDRGQPPRDYFDDPKGHVQYALDLWEDPHDVRDHKSVDEFVKTGQGRPYIPGSTIKGYLRTALAYNVVAERDGRTIDPLTDDAVQELFRLDEESIPSDVMQCVTVRDTRPVSSDALVLANLKMYNLKEAELGSEFEFQNGQMRPEYDNFAELLAPRTQLSTEITVDIKRLRRMIDRFEEPETTETPLGDRVSERDVFRTIRKALDRYRQGIVKAERRFAEDIDGTVEFYGDLDGDAHHLRLGAGTGWHSKTIGMQFRRDELEQARRNNELGKFVHLTCREMLEPDRHRPGLYCHSCDQKGIPPDSSEVKPVSPFPKTRRVVLRDGEPFAPPGWIRLTFEKG